MDSSLNLKVVRIIVVAWSIMRVTVGKTSGGKYTFLTFFGLKARSISICSQNGISSLPIGELSTLDGS